MTIVVADVFIAVVVFAVVAVALVVYPLFPLTHTPLLPPTTHALIHIHVPRRGTIVLQAVVRGRAARSAALVLSDASSTIAACWRARRETARYQGARRGVVALQSVVRGRRGREEVAARWLALGRRFSKQKAATMIQVLVPASAVVDGRGGGGFGGYGVEEVGGWVGGWV